MPCCRFAAVGDCLEIWRVWSLLALVVRVSLSVFFFVQYVSFQCCLFMVAGTLCSVFFFSLLVIFILLDIPGLSFFSPPSCYSFFFYIYKTVEDCPKIHS